MSGRHPAIAATAAAAAARSPYTHILALMCGARGGAEPPTTDIPSVIGQKPLSGWPRHARSVGAAAPGGKARGFIFIERWLPVGPQDMSL